MTIPATEMPPWLSSALTDRTVLVLLGGLVVGAAALVLLVRAWWRLHRRRGVAAMARGESGTATMEFVLVFPFILALVLVMLQTTLVMAGNLFVHYAAYSATRTAITQIPRDLPGSPANEIVTERGTTKFDEIRKAAVFAVMPVSGKLTEAQYDEAGNPPVDTGAFVAGLRDYYRSQGMTPPKWIETQAAGRLRYASHHVWITLMRAETHRSNDDVQFRKLGGGAHTFGPRDPITVEVRHDLHLSVPYASAFFRDNDHAHRTGGFTRIDAQYTLTNEGIDPALPPEPELPRSDRKRGLEQGETPDWL